MQQIQIPYKNSPDFLEKLLRLKNYYEDNSLEQIFFYVTWSGEVKGKLNTVIDKIEELFPDSLYFGNEASGNIANGEFSSGIHITCYIFENKTTKAELVWVEKGTKVPSLNALWNICKNKKHLKGIELIPSLEFSESLKIDNEPVPLSKDVFIFGGIASQYTLPCTKADILAKGHSRTSQGMAVILYSGDELYFSAKHILGWQGLGKAMKISSSQGKTITRIDNLSPTTLFEKYLGTGISASELFVFPLIVYEDGIEYLRTPHVVNDDGSIEMFVEIPKGTELRLSYGDKNTILDTAHKTAVKLSQFKPETIKAYSCGARRVFWGDEEVGKETKAFDKIAPTSGFYSSGEIIKINNKLRVCNQTLSLVAMREKEGKDLLPIDVESEETDTSVISRLAYFTRKVTQEQQEALNIAEEASKAKTNFLFNMSHDIRTPINAILGFNKIAIRELKDNPEKALESILKVQNSSDILLTIINDILDMSRIESGKARIKLDNIDINSVFENVQPVMSNLAIEKNIELTFDKINLQHPFVKADVSFIQRVLINIISNAIKYTNNGGNVKVSVEECDYSNSEDQKIYKYVVADNGIGMSKEFQKHMFEDFTREESSTISGVQGTGLGLSLALKLVQLLNGTISCESEQGVGSTFTICFPLKVIDEKNIDSIAAGERLKDVNFRDKKVLIVEDNVLNREIASDILTQEGMITEVAENGKIAVDIISEKGPNYYDFILMDIQMPIMNGYEATKAIRELYPNNKIVIIALSANAFAEDKTASIKAGMNNHVAKPIDINELKQVMAKYIKK